MSLPPPDDLSRLSRDPSHDGGAPADEAPAVARATWRDAPGLLLRGGFVGAAEGVPGVSGGTIALVVGLYDRLIDSAGQLLHAVRLLVGVVLRRRTTAEVRDALRAIDWRFLAPVLAGMAIFLLAILSTVAPLLEEHPVQVNAVFFGMIMVSLAVPIGLMPHRPGVRDLALIALAAVIAFGLTSLPQADIASPPLWLVFVGAAIAINALVVPGVSGSFVLLAMGLYIPVQQAVSNRDLTFVAVFAAGALIGLGLFVKVLQWLLHHHRQVFMAIVAGLMLGSLRSLWPWQDGTALLAPPGIGEVMACVGLAVLGGAVVAAALWWERRHPNAVVVEP